MTCCVLKVIFILVAIALSVGGWLATLWAASERRAAIAFSVIGMVLISAAFRGRFASSERARDFWTGFALFGLLHFVADRKTGGYQLMTTSVVQRIGDLVLGPDNPGGYAYKFLTPLGNKIAAMPIEWPWGGQIWAYLPYVRQTTSLFAGLIFAAIGGLAACHLRRRSVRMFSIPSLRGCPLLGLAWLCLLTGLICLTFAIHSDPVCFPNGTPFPKCPASISANFLLYNVEFLAVLFAALEARFAVEGERAWWLGFAVFGGVHLLTFFTSLSWILPTKWMSDSLIESLKGIGFESIYIWHNLATFLPVAWLGTLASRLVRRLGTASTWPRFLDRSWVRSSIGRIMLALVPLGFFLAVVKYPSELHLIEFGNATVGLLLFAAFRASSGPETARAWWWGFALFGGIDLVFTAKEGVQVFPPEWPIHDWLVQYHRTVFEEYIAGQAIPHMPDYEDIRQATIYGAYTSSRQLTMMSVCLPMAWIGAILASLFDRCQRSIASSSEISQ